MGKALVTAERDIVFFHQKPVSILTLAPKALMKKLWQQILAMCQGKHLVQNKLCLSAVLDRRAHLKQMLQTGLFHIAC